MAGRIAGITIEIGGDTTNLQKSLKSVDSQLKTTQANLKDINKLLKLDPSNTELLKQKQKELEKAISQTKERLAQLKDAQKGVAKGSEEWDKIQREIIETEQNLKQLQSEYKKFGSVAGQQIQAFGSKLQSAGSSIEDFGRKLMPLSTAATAVGGALLKLGYDAVTGADDMNTLAKQTGFSVEEIQKMKYAADLIDVSFEDIAGALKKLKPKSTENNEALSSLGVATTKADGSLRDANAVFYDTVAALSKIDNETERDQKAMEIFGKSADQLAGIIDDGGKALAEYGGEAKRLGLILDGDTLDALNETNDTIDKMKATVKGTVGVVGKNVAKVLAPMVEKFAKKVQDLSAKLGKLTPKQTEMVLKVVALTAAIAPAIIAIGKVVKTVGTAISIFGKLVGSLNGVTLIIAAVVAAGIILYKNWDTISAYATKMKNSVVASWNALKTSVINTTNAIKTSVVNSWNNLKNTVINAWNTVKTSVTTATDSLKTSVVNSFNNLKTAVVNAWNAVKNSVINTANNVKSSVSSAWESMKSSVINSVNNLKNAVVNGWSSLKSAVVNAAYNVKDSVVNAWNNLKNSAISTVSGMVSSIKSLFSFDFHLPELKLPSWSDIHARLSTIISNIKSLFNFDWSLPHIKVPHFSVQGGKAPYGLGGQGYLPSINVSWYRRAYDNPLLFTSPTVMATPTGYKGFGDGSGAEIVMGLNKLQELVGGAGDVVINVYPSAGMDVNQLADAIQARFVAMNKQRRLAHA